MGERTKHQADSDLIEQLEEEEMSELVRDAQEEAFRKAALKKEGEKPVRRFPRWLFWVITAFSFSAPFPSFFKPTPYLPLNF